MRYNFSNPSEAKTRILVVENDPKAREGYQKLLSFWDYDTVPALGTGKSLIEDAKQKAREFRCSLALIDLRLTDDYNDNDRSGLHLAEELPNAIRPVILSGHVDPEILIKLLQKRVDLTFIKKDLERDAFREMLDAEAEKANAARRNLTFENPDLLADIAVSALGGHTNGYPDQIADILARLFPHAKRLRLEKLEMRPASSNISTIPRPNSVVFKVFEEDLEAVVVKLARAEKTQVEVNNYFSHIHMKLTGGYTARLERSAILWDIGGASYSFVGNFDIKPFSVFYEENNVIDIEECLSAFFNGIWKKFYDNAYTKNDLSLFEIYTRVWGDWYEKKVKGINFSSSDLAIPASLPDPIHWLKEKIIKTNSASGVSEEVRVAITHGDLHGDNLLVDSKKIAWVIDFERCGEGHVLQDFVELESDIYNRLEAHSFNNAAFIKMYLHILKEKRIQELSSIETFSTDEQIHKALKTVSFLRSLALNHSKITDAKEYLLGLLFNATFRAALVSKTNLQKSMRPLLLASLICHRLDHWDDPWPPSDWNI